MWVAIAALFDRGGLDFAFLQQSFGPNRRGAGHESDIDAAHVCTTPVIPYIRPTHQHRERAL